MIAEKHGWLFTARNIFGFTIPQYGYNWSYSNAYLEILLSDTVIMDFGDKKKVSKYDIDRTREVWEKSKNKVNTDWGTVAKK